MVLVQAPPYKIFSKDFIEGETVGQLFQRIVNDESLEYRGAWSMQETQTGRVLNSDDLVIDDRVYHLNVMFAV